MFSNTGWINQLGSVQILVIVALIFGFVVTLWNMVSYRKTHEEESVAPYHPSRSLVWPSKFVAEHMDVKKCPQERDLERFIYNVLILNKKLSHGEDILSFLLKHQDAILERYPIELYDKSTLKVETSIRVVVETARKRNAL
jgi:hypothetical protein